jgi:uncharacterized Zn finger protein
MPCDVPHRPWPSPDFDVFDLTCDQCGARMQVTVLRAFGHEQLETYDCLECHNVFFCHGAEPPSVRLLAPKLNRSTHVG